MLRHVSALRRQPLGVVLAGGGDNGSVATRRSSRWRAGRCCPTRSARCCAARWIRSSSSPSRRRCCPRWVTWRCGRSLSILASAGGGRRGAAAGGGGWVLVCAGDMPFVPVALLASLASRPRWPTGSRRRAAIVVASPGGSLQPLLACYGPLPGRWPQRPRGGGAHPRRRRGPGTDRRPGERSPRAVQRQLGRGPAGGRGAAGRGLIRPGSGAPAVTGVTSVKSGARDAVHGSEADLTRRRAERGRRDERYATRFDLAPTRSASPAGRRADPGTAARRSRGRAGRASTSTGLRGRQSQSIPIRTWRRCARCDGPRARRRSPRAHGPRRGRSGRRSRCDRRGSRGRPARRAASARRRPRRRTRSDAGAQRIRVHRGAAGREQDRPRPRSSIGSTTSSRRDRAEDAEFQRAADIVDRRLEDRLHELPPAAAVLQHLDRTRPCSQDSIAPKRLSVTDVGSGVRRVDLVPGPSSARSHELVLVPREQTDAQVLDDRSAARPRPRGSVRRR